MAGKLEKIMGISLIGIGIYAGVNYCSNCNNQNQDKIKPSIEVSTYEIDREDYDQMAEPQEPLPDLYPEDSIDSRLEDSINYNYKNIIN